MTIKFVISLAPELQTLLNGMLPMSRLEGKLDQLLVKQEQIRMKLEDFQAKIDTINANTTASAAAAQAAATAAANASSVGQTISGQLADLRERIQNAGLDATQEASLLASLDSAAAGTTAVANANAGLKDVNEALATFLTQVATGPSEPAPVPVPEIPTT